MVTCIAPRSCQPAIACFFMFGTFDPKYTCFKHTQYLVMWTTGFLLYNQTHLSVARVGVGWGGRVFFMTSALYFDLDFTFLPYGPGIGDNEMEIDRLASIKFGIAPVPFIFYLQELHQIYVSQARTQGEGGGSIEPPLSDRNFKKN